MKTIMILPAKNEPHAFDVEATAKWLIRQTKNTYPCGASDIKVIQRTAELVIERREKIAFRVNNQILPPNLILGFIRKGKDPRPE